MCGNSALHIALHTRQAALGVAGVEGGFRAGCEAAMGALRVGGPALGALLAASLADPLIDWAAERDDRHARQARPCARCQGSVAVTGAGSALWDPASCVLVGTCAFVLRHMSLG